MKLPQQAHTLPNGLHAPVREIGYGSWHYHLLKHPLGLHRRMRADGRPVPWNLEGWTDTEPAVVGEQEHGAILEAIRKLEVGGKRCAVAEVRGKRLPKKPERDYGCRQCPQALAEACGEVLHQRFQVGPRYAAVVEDLLEALGDACVVSRADALAAFNAAVHRQGSDALKACVVASAGSGGERDRGLPILRISAGAGVRAEFYRDGAQLRWRTCYRQRGVRGVAAVTFLGGQLAAPTHETVSEKCLVRRQWWEAHGL